MFNDPNHLTHCRDLKNSSFLKIKTRIKFNFFRN